MARKTRTRNFRQRRASTRNKWNCNSKDRIVHVFMEMSNLVKMYHWNTKSFAQHKATDELHERLQKNIDAFVEILLGKNSTRLTSIDRNIRLYVPKNVDSLKQRVFNYRTFLLQMDTCLNQKMDSDLLNIRDEMLADINQFLYLLTLK